MTQKGVNVNWVGNYEFLSFTFPQVLDKKSADAAIKAWDHEFALQPSRVDLIWDCTDMNDYDPVARMNWQKALTAHKGQINTIYLISDSAMIRAAAKIFSLFVGVSIKPVKCMDEVLATKLIAA